ncbi:MAG: DUF4198 domain-containing protein [Treponema sp.]
MKLAKIFFVLLLAVLVNSVYAHFQLVYTPQSVIPENAADAEFKLVFTHPFEAGHTMDIGKNQAGEIKGMKEFFSVHKGQKTDLLPGLKDIVFKSMENEGKGYVFTLNKEYGLRGGGDWVLVAVPQPYYESSEDIYIQQITKVMINKGDLSTDWSERAADGYPEILPLVKPYDVWTGGIFRGVVVDGKGKPVPYAEIEFEYINYDIDMQNNKFTGTAKLEKTGAGTMLANAQGVFEFIPPRAGYWGFAALGAGGEKEFGGKELSEDAVLWIEAQPLEDAATTETVQTAADAHAVPASSSEKGSGIPVLPITAVVLIAAAGIAFVAMKKKK